MMMIAGEVLVLGHCRPRGGRQSNYTNASATGYSCRQN